VPNSVPKAVFLAALLWRGSAGAVEIVQEHPNVPLVEVDMTGTLTSFASVTISDAAVNTDGGRAWVNATGGGSLSLTSGAIPLPWLFEEITDGIFHTRAGVAGRAVRDPGGAAYFVVALDVQVQTWGLGAVELTLSRVGPDPNLLSLLGADPAGPPNIFSAGSDEVSMPLDASGGDAAAHATLIYKIGAPTTGDISGTWRLTLLPSE
jgi:hypothetical protein